MLPKAWNLRFPKQLPTPTLTSSSQDSAPSFLVPSPPVSGTPPSPLSVASQMSWAPYFAAGVFCIRVDLLFFRMLQSWSSQGLWGCKQVNPERGLYPELYTPDTPDLKLGAPDTLVPGFIAAGFNSSGYVPDPRLWSSTSPVWWLGPEPRTATPLESQLEPGLRITLPPECRRGP